MKMGTPYSQTDLSLLNNKRKELVTETIKELLQKDPAVKQTLSEKHWVRLINRLLVATILNGTIKYTTIKTFHKSEKVFKLEDFIIANFRKLPTTTDWLHIGEAIRDKRNILKFYEY